MSGFALAFLSVEHASLCRVMQPSVGGRGTIPSVAGKHGWRHRRERKAVFLRNVRSRLVAEVGICSPVLRANGVGFWAMTRMLMPVIEAVSSSLYRTSKVHGEPPAVLLRNLSVPNPKVVWKMYRNALMHHDELGTLHYKRWRVGCSLAFGGGHGFGRGKARGSAMVHVDLEKLYNDLVAFLDSEARAAAAKGTWTLVNQQQQTGKGQKVPSSPLLKEIEALCRKPLKRG
jgi:hypothetical protein